MSIFVPVFILLTSGCTSTGGFAPPWKKTEVKADGPKDNVTLTGGRGLEREPVDPGLQKELDTAKRLAQGGMLVTVVGAPKDLSSKEPGG